MTKAHANTQPTTHGGRVYLVASSQKQTLDAMIARAVATFTRKPARIAASFAAAGGPHAGQMSTFLTKAFAGSEVTRFTVKGEAHAMSPADARAIVERADLVFLGGGDPIHGAHLFANAGADQWLRDANARGAACMGISAGAIMLCAWWAEWPDDAPKGAPHDGGHLVPCAGVVPDLVVDCHAEEDHWSELHLVRGLLHDRIGERAKDGAHEKLPRLLGLPTGGGVIVSPDGLLETVGNAPIRLS